MKESILTYSLLCILMFSCKKEATVPQDIKYFSRVKQIITTNCLQCHNSADPFNSWSGRPVKLDSDDDLTSQYSNIKASIADPPSFSNKRMPLGSELSASETDVIVKWYNKGGKSTD